MSVLTVIGGGLAGCEAAWQAARRGIEVDLYEMRPVVSTGVHISANLAELVCSNSLGSNQIDRAAGLLKEEIHRLGSLLLTCANDTALPAGGALAVDREAFSRRVTELVATHPFIHLIRAELPEIPSTPTIVASGPLTSSALSNSIAHLSDEQNLFFFDAIAPIVDKQSINMQVAYRASRWGVGNQDDGDYINCPFSREEYDQFITALCQAERIELKSFEEAIRTGVHVGAHTFFEACLPVEIMAERSPNSLAFGPMRPSGLRDPRTGRWPFAVLQLRQDNLAGDLYNLVGFQTNLTFPEQRRVFRMVPGLEEANFIRYGQMHRNTFIASPRLLRPTLQFHSRDDLFFAGQITGVEGYMGNIATGLLAGLNAARLLQGVQPLEFPRTSMLGALCNYITHASMTDFQPMKANLGILPPLQAIPRGKKERGIAHARRALADLDVFFQQNGLGG